MAKLELDVNAIDIYLKMTERNRAWLGRKIGASDASMSYIWRVKPISQAERIGNAIGIQPKTLIKQTETENSVEGEHEQT